MSQEVYVSRQDIIQLYGFSANLILELGQPDFVRANARWGWTYFYDLARVEQFAEEHAERIQRILAERSRRQMRARRSTRQRREETIAWSQNVPLHLEPIPPSTLAAARRYFAPASLTRERLLLYLRLTCTDYVEMLSLTAHRPGAAEARQILRERANQLIETALRAQGLALPHTRTGA